MSDERSTVGLGMVWSTGHSAHHVVRVLTTRRILGAWPPPGGS